jgi:hypothetical protein
MEWANATPQKRQQKLESITKDRMADVFFSLHIDDIAGADTTFEVSCERNC